MARTHQNIEGIATKYIADRLIVQAFVSMEP